jgi:hypothetical protein
MALSVTLPGAGGTGTVTVQSGGGDNVFVAQIIANTILLASVGGSLDGGTVTPDLNPAVSVTVNGGVTIAPPPLVNGNENILYLFGSGGGSLNVPTGYNYVIDLMTGPETIAGTDVQVISTDPASGVEFNLSGNSSIAADPPPVGVNLTESGVQNIATGAGNDTISLVGAGTMDGGAGSNILDATPTVGGTGIRVQSDGTNDTVNVFGAPGGVATVVSTGDGMSLTANGVVTVDALLLGKDDTVSGGAGASDVSAGGSAALIFGGIGTLSVADSGTSDTIFASGASSASVDAFGTGALVFGGLNNITATLGGSGAQGHNSLVGGFGITSATLNGTANVVLGGPGSLSVDDVGTSDTIGAFSSTTPVVTLGGANDLLFVGSNALAATVTGSDDTVVGGAAASTITATSGAAVFASSGLVNFIGGAGTSTILGGTGDTQMVTVGSGGLLFFSGTGDNSSITGGLGQTTIIGASGSNVFVSSLSGSGGFEFLAGSGNATLNAAGSTTNNIFGFFDSATSVGGGAHDTISGWTTVDSLFLGGYDSTATTTIAGGGNLTFNLSDGTSITFTNATSNEFTGRILYS